MNKSPIFFNHSFDKKRLKALISWVLKRFGEQEALRVIEILKKTGFYHATQAGISIGLHDLTTPLQKPSLISNCEVTMNITRQDFSGARITATERSQRIIDTWHRASDSLRKQVVDHFTNYDPFNPVYIMALSGARGNFSQVRQLTGMRGLMADQQGKIVNFPIRSNLREGLTLTEYFISCSGARKGLVDTALRTADTGYLTRRLVDVSHHVVVKRVRCNTHRRISVKPLYSYNKILLTLKERLVGRVLAEDIEGMPSDSVHVSDCLSTFHLQNFNCVKNLVLTKPSVTPPLFASPYKMKPCLYKSKICMGRSYKTRPSFVSRTDLIKGRPCKARLNFHIKDGTQTKGHFERTNLRFLKAGRRSSSKKKLVGTDQVKNENKFCANAAELQLAKKDQEISPELASQIELVRQQVYIRSPLTCQFTDSVCQLCYGWSMSQGNLVPLGDAVGVIAAQSIGEPGTQLTMRTFHTGGVFSGDLLQEIKAPHAGKVGFSQAFQGLVIRTAQGRIAFLTKISGELLLKPFFESSSVMPDVRTIDTKIPIPALTMLFVRQGEEVEKNQLLAEFSIVTKEGNQPVKSRQTLFAELSGKVIEDRGGATWVKELEEDSIEEEEDPFKFVEPRRSGRLGFFQIIAARIGATFSYKHPIASLKKNVNEDFFQMLKKKSNNLVRSAPLLNRIDTLDSVKLGRDCLTLLKQPSIGVLKRTTERSSAPYFKHRNLPKRYLHPEFVKNNALCLQTIAEHGDIVDEKYKKIVTHTTNTPYFTI